MQTWAPAGSLNFQIAQEDCDHLKRMTDGRIDVTPMAAGAICGYSEMLETMGLGIFEICFGVAACYGGLEPGMSVIWNLPGIWEDPRQVKIWYETWGGNELQAQMYEVYNVHFLNTTGRGAEPLMGNVPMDSLEDFKGIKVRTGAGLTWDLFTKLGAVAVEMEGDEVYTALDTGLVDIAEFVTVATNYSMGFHEVSKYILSPSFQSPTGNNDVSINMDVWNELPDDLKAILEAWTKYFGARQDYVMSGEDIKSLQAMKDYGIIHCQLPSDDWATLRTYSFEILEPYKEKSPMSRAVLESVIDFLTASGKL